jgi:hypothetical protein
MQNENLRFKKFSESSTLRGSSQDALT